MKVLVTGGAGFIGSHVVDLYIEHGYEVVVVDDLSTGRRANLNPAATFYYLDIRSPEVAEVFAKERPDFVNHHAAQMDLSRSVIDPQFDADVNIRGSINLLECSRQYGVKRFIYISAGGAVYGEPEYLPCDEEHPVHPLSPYGASKHTIEHYLYMYHIHYGLDYTVLRYPHVYGPRQDPNGEAGVIAIFSALMLTDQQVLIFSDGEQQRDFVYVSDCAQANLLALTHSSGCAIYNIGSNHGISINEIFNRLRQITGYRREAVYAPGKLGGTRCIYLSSAKASRELNWEPRVTIDEGLAKTVEFFAQEERVS